MNQLKISNESKDSDPNIVYLNINIKGSNDPEKVVEALYSENRTVAILDNPNDYILGLVRFSVPSMYIPIFRWATQFPQPFTDDSLRVYMQYSGVTVFSPLSFILKTNDPLLSNERLIWNFQDFIDIVNEAIVDAFTLISAVPGFPVGINVPRLVLDSASNLIYLYVDVAFQTNFINIGFSRLLYSYFPSFATFEDVLAVPGKTIYRIQLYDNIINNVTYLGNPAYKLSQEFPTLSLWSNVDKLLFVSNSIPIDTELEGSQTNIQSRVIFDFVLDNSQLNDRTNIIYYSQGNQRYYDLLSNYPMKRTDISVQILFKDGTTLPLKLLSTDTLSLKLQFIKKGSMTNLN